MNTLIPITFGSVCSGIEAASVAWHPLGWEAAWLSEIEPFPSAVLAHHYPGVPNLGDMTKIAARVRSGDVAAPDVLVGGTPCQAFSVAGLRKSLGDTRGQLTLSFFDLANAIDSARSFCGEPPTIIVWENVPGVLSTKDNAFGCFLAGLVGEDCELKPPRGKWTNAGCVFGPQRAAVWRVLDAKFFGLAQRRRRVFVVASAGCGADPVTVLFEFDGVRRDIAPSREKREIAPTLPARSTGGGGLGTDFDLDGGLIAMGNQAGSNPIPFGVSEQPDIGHCLRSGASKADKRESTTYVVQPLSYGIRTANTSSNGWGIQAECTHTLDQAMGVAVAQAMAFPANLSGTQCASTENLAPAMGAKNPTAVAYPVNIYGGNRRKDRPEGGFYVRLDEDTSKTLDAASGLNPACSQGGTAVMQAVAFAQNSRDEVRLMNGDGHIVGALSAQPGMKQTCYVAQTQMAVRRLTPAECEKLQGFEPGYTAIPWRGKPADQCPDAPRYKAIGNSMAVPVMHWIGKRIDEQIKRAET